MPADQKQIEKKKKKENWCVWDKGIYLTDERTMIYVYYGTIHALCEYQKVFKTFLRMN